MRRLMFLTLLGLALLALLAVSGGAQPTAAQRDPQSGVPPPTWTPIPTPDTTGRPKLDAPAPPLDKASQFPFDQCVNWWCEEYYNDFWQGGPAGDRVNSRNDRNEIDYYWGLDRPMSNVDTDYWAARFRRRIRIQTPGVYRFFIFHDDGIKVLINNRSIWPRDELWGAIGPNVPSFHFFRWDVYANQDLDIEIQYFDAEGVAFLKFWWAFEPSCQIDPAGGDCARFPLTFPNWRAEYFNNPNCPTAWPSGLRPQDRPWDVDLYYNQLVVRDEDGSGPDYVGQPGEGLFFDWGLGPPIGNLSDEAFSTRFTRQIQFSGGNYRFYLRVDDGGRLWIDGQRVIDQWRACNAYTAPNTYIYDTYLAPGTHEVRVEQQELIGAATVRFWWESR